MTRLKKKFPLTVLQTLEELMKEKSPYYEIVDSEELLRFNDKDPKSDFFYAIKGHSFSKEGKLMVNVSYKPRSKDILGLHERNIDAKLLKGSLTNWNNLLAEYDKVRIFDDPILKQYQDEFLADFELLDEDADYSSYDLKVQIWIDEYLEHCKTKLIEIKTEENKIEVEKAEKEIEDLKNNQTNLTKRKVVERLAKIWAYTRKLGLKLIKDVYEETKKEIIKQLIKGQIDIM